jgi:hypothetical protein
MHESTLDSCLRTETIRTPEYDMFDECVDVEQAFNDNRINKEVISKEAVREWLCRTARFNDDAHNAVCTP